MMSNFFQRIYNYVQRRKWLIPFCFVLILSACGLSLWTSKLEEDITKILPNNEEIDKFNEGFLDSEMSNRMIVHLSTEKDSLSDELGEFCQLIVDSLSSPFYDEAIRSITYKMDASLFQNLSSNILENLPLFLEEEDYQVIEQSIQPDAIEERTYGAYKALLSPASFAFKDILRKDPLGFSNLVFEQLTNFQLDDNFELNNGYLITKDKKHLLFFISPLTKVNDSRNVNQLIKDIKGIGKHYEKNYSDIKFEYFGGPAIAAANSLRIKKDVSLTVSIALLSLLFIITYFYKDWKIFFYILLPVLAGAAAALAIIGFAKTNLSIIAIGVGSVLIGIGIDFSIHLFTHFKKTGNVREVFKDVSSPILLSAITTSTAFLCLYFVRSEALHDLGLFAALSVFCAAVFALLILPHFFSKKPQKVYKKTFIDKIAAYPYHKNKMLSIGILCLFAFCAFWAPNVAFEKNLNNINYMSQELLEAEENINSISDATKRGIYLISIGENLNEALDHSSNLEPKLKELKASGKIESFSTPNQLLSSERMQQEKIKRWKDFWTPEKIEFVERQIIEQTTKLKFKASAFSSFFDLLKKDFKPTGPQKLDEASGGLLKDYYAVKDENTTVTTMIRLDPEDKKHVHAAFAEREKLAIIDKEYIVHQFVDTLKTDFNKLVWISLLVVLILLHIVYGRPELAMVAFLPICFSWVITLGLMNLMDIKFNIVNIIITSFIFGLGIDYSIFVLRGLLQKYRTGEDNLTSYKTSILLSSFTTLIGIGVLIFAKHPALKSIASISLIGIFSVLLVTYILQPLIFNWLTEKNGEKRDYPLTLSNMGKTLWVYFTLAMGCLLLTVLGVILQLLFFIPIELRKTFFHHCIYWLSKAYIKVSFLSRVTYQNESKEDFSKPSLIVANHKSLIDTPLFFQLTPKVLIITNDWVNKSPLYRMICKFADFYSISRGADDLLNKLQDRVNKGYSIAIFPEGTRSKTEELLRLKKGSFYLAEKLQLDIVPMLIHGTLPFLSKGNFFGRASDITVRIKERIPHSSGKFGNDYSTFTKSFGKWFKEQYRIIRKDRETVDYHREEIIYNYIYKGPITEHYTRVKTRMEENYKIFDSIISHDSLITDLGCGLGHMTFFLGKTRPNRKFISMDYDCNKVEIANNCAIKTSNMRFSCADVRSFELENSDVFIISDMLHYLKPKEQFQLLERCLNKLNPGGKIILRDGDRDLEKRHEGTKWTEIFSTKMGFNKTANELHFISGQELKNWCVQRELKLSKLDETKFTSNVIFVIENTN